MLQLVGPCGQNALPNWVPEAAQHYLIHTETGRSIRALARGAGCHASTVLRQVRRFENRRDDPLIDEALRNLGAAHFRGKTPRDDKDQVTMTAQFSPSDLKTDDETISREGRRILRRLCETGAVLAVAADMEKAVVMRTAADGSSTRTAVVDRSIAQAMALKEWISCNKSGRISRYEITSVGRAALKRLLETAPADDDDADSQYANQHREWGEKSVSGQSERVRYNLAESPLAGLARRKDKNGEPFLSEDLVAAGERLREDFELAQMGPRVAQNWDKFLTGGDRGGFNPDSGFGNGPADARDRVAEALSDLGPGLGDVVLRCCCFLEGMETAEKRMGWSARSGKIVLRIALQRLKRHYEERYGPYGPMIG
ncbi:DUF6456 domain-containing protein [Parasulfitobacter algicola]|uniref:Helix-turn-helix domain-containing protein n=1 Tax=Parasulfitobacter algicola TaxID=2614809 RepID=A0ABX2ISC6_9RHOB|nr:DUF6456 domain-containing protein [Sulfitobacter algicola]NSX55799.1 helix-turn-helix domain-containing protein [Sulfitobacter algicola]